MTTPVDPRLETLALLRSIDASLKHLVRRSVVGGHAPAGAEIADDRDLDGKWGDPLVKFTPRDWTGADYKGSPMSACPPAFLELLASAFDYFAQQADEKGELTTAGKPVAGYKRKDAARARGWAKRNRARGGPAPATPGTAEADAFASDWT